MILSNKNHFNEKGFKNFQKEKKYLLYESRQSVTNDELNNGVWIRFGCIRQWII